MERPKKNRLPSLVLDIVEQPIETDSRKMRQIFMQAKKIWLRELLMATVLEQNLMTIRLKRSTLSVLIFMRSDHLINTLGRLRQEIQAEWDVDFNYICKRLC